MYSVDKLPSNTSTVHQLPFFNTDKSLSHLTNTTKFTTKLTTMYNLFSSTVEQNYTQI